MRRFIFIILFIVFFTSNSLVFAGPNADPKTELITVSASIADNIPPTTPILISPTNNSYLTTGYPTFIWQRSTDENGIKEYELLIDGAVLITDIPPHDAETSQFIVDYEATTDYYTLKVKDLIADGTHTWKMIAIDTLENGSDSATWSFTIDTQAPSFVLTQVGTVPTSISAQDISTVPTSPIELTENSPQLLGSGEANSTVFLTVTIPGDPTQSFTATTDINGNWGQLLGILPRDVIINLDFTITDQAGLISILNNVPFMIRTDLFVFPPQDPTPSPLPTLSPGATPSTSPPPTTPTTPILFTIPLTPAIEIAHEILQETIEKTPAPIKELIAQIPPQVRKEMAQAAANSTPVISLGVTSPLIILAILSIVNRFHNNLSPKLVWETMQALHLLPALGDHPQGFIFNSQTEARIPFALLEIRSEDEETIDQVVTDEDGFYRGLDLDSGEYQFIATHPDYKAHLQTGHAYPLIPIDLLTEAPQKRVKVGPSLSSFNMINKALFWPLFIITGGLTLIFPSLWNWLILATYPLQLLARQSYRFQPVADTE
mgnify:CR=1 FL=1